MAVINKTSAIKKSLKHLLGIQNLTIQEAKKFSMKQNHLLNSIEANQKN